MKILYGIQATGNGHITRSAKLMSKLVKIGCQVDVLMSGKNSQVNFPFPIKWNFTGLTFYYDGNGKINYWKTFWELKSRQFLKDVRLNIEDYDLIISDFEPITAWASEFQNKISVGVGNQYSFLSEMTPRPDKKDFLGEKILKWYAPVKFPIGLHFEPYDEFIKTPIIRDALMTSDIQSKGHYTVYLANWDFEQQMKYLTNINCKFEVFCKVRRPFRFKNCYVKPIEKTTFDTSFKESSGIITAGGFQTCSEALFLNKHLIVLPINNQYEQRCNAESLKKFNVDIGEFEDVQKFIYSSGKQQRVDWVDPTDEIVNKILQLGVK